MKPKTALTISFAWLLCVALWLAFYHEPDPIPTGREVVIVPGMSNRAIADLLYQQGLAPAPDLFLLYLSLTGQKNLQAGRYVFQGNESIQTIIAILSSGFSGRQRVTLPEGLTSRQMAIILEQEHIIRAEDYLALVDQPDRFPRPWLDHARTLDGFLFPDTYYFLTGSLPETVINTQLDRFEELFLDEYRAEQPSLSLVETVILASIVERETKWSHERPLVASVFINRLNQNMRLQSCATVVYALAEELGINRDTLTREDLAFDSPYNTYREAGLPPGPIGNPGLSSLQAVINPASSDYLFFILHQDGQHRFSRTYREHLAYRDASR